MELAFQKGKGRGGSWLAKSLTIFQKMLAGIGIALSCHERGETVYTASLLVCVIQIQKTGQGEGGGDPRPEEWRMESWNSKREMQRR